MRRALAIVFVVLCVVFFALPAFAMKNEPEGFRGIPWGTPAPENDLNGKNKWGLVKLIDLMSETLYFRKNESALMGGARVESISYYFQESLGFARAVIEFSGAENCELLRKACIENWGSPDIERKNSTKEYDGVTFFWFGEKISIRLSYNNREPYSGYLGFFINNYMKVVDKDNVKYYQRLQGF